VKAFLNHSLFPVRRVTPSAIRQSEKGFSLLEMIVTIVVLLGVMGVALTLMTAQQKSTVTQQLKGDMYQSLRGATELMTQEIGQAGLVSLPSVTNAACPNTTQPTLTQAVAASAVAQLVSVTAGTVDSMFVGEKLLIDTGAPEELVTLTAVNASTDQITAIFSNPNGHATCAVIKVYGTFPGGLMSSSDGTHLKLFGDINSNGTLAYVEYDCNANAAGTGTLTRSTTTVTPLTIAANTADTLLSNVLSNPGGTACFQYTTQTVTVSGTPYTFVTNAAITLSVQTAERDPQSGRFLTMTKTLLNVAPRNVLMGYELATAAPPVATHLQPTPPNLLTW
jgi:prepilin-type N-terminal cleavage/methylation domain-containing protein